MALEKDYRLFLRTQEFFARQTRIQQCGLFIADYFHRGSDLFLDVDGVIFKADGLDAPQVTTPDIIAALQQVEKSGINIGVATARGMQVIDYLRSQHHLQMNGTSILEEGHVYLKDGKKEYLAHPNHMQFMKEVRQLFMLQDSFHHSWQEVKLLFEGSRQFAFCPGNFQWQGECRASFWFYAKEEKDYDQKILSQVFEPVLRKIALHNGLDYEKDLAISANRMSVGNLGILSIKGKLDGATVNKATVAGKLKNSWVFVADGFGDEPLAIATLQKHGGVIGLEGNLDVSNDAYKFLRKADIILRDPEQLTQSLFYAVAHL